MPRRKATTRRQHWSVKRRLFDETTPKKSKESTITTPVLLDHITDGTQSQSAIETITASSSMLKRNEQEVQKDPKLSPDLTYEGTARSDSPLLSSYFGHIERASRLE